jgi:hypothetical protein
VYGGHYCRVLPRFWGGEDKVGVTLTVATDGVSSAQASVLTEFTHLQSYSDLYKPHFKFQLQFWSDLLFHFCKFIEFYCFSIYEITSTFIFFVHFELFMLYFRTIWRNMFINGWKFSFLNYLPIYFIICQLQKATRGLEPISYRGALLSTLLYVTVYVVTQFSECTITDCK